MKMKIQSTKKKASSEIISSHCVLSSATGSSLCMTNNDSLVLLYFKVFTILEFNVQNFLIIHQPSILKTGSLQCEQDPCNECRFSLQEYGPREYLFSILGPRLLAIFWKSNFILGLPKHVGLDKKQLLLPNFTF